MNHNREPGTAPQPEKWYELKLGSSFKDNSCTKFCTLRYEFKPASIDKNQAGSLHKNKENRVTVEFHNNQPGKPKVTFEGSSEDYKENDAVLFFDGETFRLERLHRAMKRLRHVRQPGESVAAASVAPGPASVGLNAESRSPPIGKGAKAQQHNKPILHAMPVEVERIDIGEPESPGPKPTSRNIDSVSPSRVNPSAVSPDAKSFELEENLDIVDDDEQVPINTSNAGQETNIGLDINMPNQNDTDDEIADVDVSDDEAEKGPNAAEALRAQVNAEERDAQTSSSSESSGSASSGSASGSGTSSSDSDDSDDDSASSGGDIEI